MGLGVKNGGFDFTIKGLEDLSSDAVSDKTSLRALFLFNLQAIDHNRKPKNINTLANKFP